MILNSHSDRVTQDREVIRLMIFANWCLIEHWSRWRLIKHWSRWRLIKNWWCQGFCPSFLYVCDLRVCFKFPSQRLGQTIDVKRVISAVEFKSYLMVRSLVPARGRAYITAFRKCFRGLMALATLQLPGAPENSSRIFHLISYPCLWI